MLVEVFKLPIAIARPLMVYGPGQSDLTKLVPHVLSQLLVGRKAPLSSGVHPFDWVYIDDVSDALLAIADCEFAIGRTIDVGTGVLTPVIDVARGLARRLNATDLLEVGAVADRVGEPVRAADTATTKTLVGWEARVALEEGLDLTAGWFKNRASDRSSRRGTV
jgi:UDP-glucose 4-epimerase